MTNNQDFMSPTFFEGDLPGSQKMQKEGNIREDECHQMIEGPIASNFYRNYRAANAKATVG